MKFEVGDLVRWAMPSEFRWALPKLRIDGDYLMISGIIEGDSSFDARYGVIHIRHGKYYRERLGIDYVDEYFSRIN